MTPEHLQILRQVLPRVLVSGPAADAARECNLIQSVLDAVESDIAALETEKDEPTQPGDK